jgi:hypothetical protein
MLSIDWPTVQPDLIIEATFFDISFPTVVTRGTERLQLTIPKSNPITTVRFHVVNHLSRFNDIAL